MYHIQMFSVEMNRQCIEEIEQLCDLGQRAKYADEICNEEISGKENLKLGMLREKH